MIPAKLRFTAIPAKRSPSKAQFLDPPPSTTSTCPFGIVSKAFFTKTLSSKTLTVEIGPEKACFPPKDLNSCLQIASSLENSSHKSVVLNDIKTHPSILFFICQYIMIFRRFIHFTFNIQTFRNYFHSFFSYILHNLLTQFPGHALTSQFVLYICMVNNELIIRPLFKSDFSF